MEMVPVPPAPVPRCGKRWLGQAGQLVLSCASTSTARATAGSAEPVPWFTYCHKQLWGTAPQYFISHSPIPMGSCPRCAMGSSACPTCGDTSSGAKLAASSPYKEKSLLSANLAFSASSPQGLKSPGLPQGRRRRTHVVGNMEEGKVAALMQTMNQRLWFRLRMEQRSSLEAVQQPKCHTCWRITLSFVGSVSSGWASEQVCPTDPPTLVLARRALGRAVTRVSAS